MTRFEFEKLIHGEWEKLKGDRLRRNGSFITYVRKPYKFISNGDLAFKAKTWKEIALALRLVDGKKSPQLVEEFKPLIDSKKVKKD